MDALELANRVRVKRKELKRELAIGHADARALLGQPPAFLHTAEVLDFLTWVPKIGKTKAKKLCVQVRITPTRKLESLSPRQRNELCDLLPARRTPAMSVSRR